MPEEVTTKRSRKERRRALIPAQFKPRFWADADARVAIVKLIRKRYVQLKEDCACDCMQRDLLVQRAVFLSIVLETAEIEAAETGKLDLGTYTQACNALSGLLLRLGLEKRVKQAGDLKSYIDAKESTTRTNGHSRRHQ